MHQKSQILDLNEKRLNEANSVQFQILEKRDHFCREIWMQWKKTYKKSLLQDIIETRDIKSCGNMFREQELSENKSLQNIRADGEEVNPRDWIAQKVEPNCENLCDNRMK